MTPYTFDELFFFYRLYCFIEIANDQCYTASKGKQECNLWKRSFRFQRTKNSLLYEDFYDLYVLVHQYDFDGKELAKAVEETFKHRKTPLNDITAFESGFADDPLRQSKWNAFVKRKKAMLSISLEETIQSIRHFTTPIINALLQNEVYLYHWCCKIQDWIESKS